VHCQVGVSRSATIVAAYIMRRNRITVDDALEKMAQQRLVNPNFGFMQQLLLYHKMGFKVDKRNPEYREYMLRKIATSPKNVEILEEILPDDDLDSTVGDSNQDGKRLLYRCRKCRRNLFTSDCTLKKHEASDPTINAKCSDNLFISPLRWMLQHILQQDGKIFCPGCQAKLGAFNWAGEQCGCGVWVTPAFRIQQCKLDSQSITKNSSQE